MASSAGTPVPAVLRELLVPHVSSFDYFVTTGLQTMVQTIQPAVLHLNEGGTVKWSFQELVLSKPTKSDGASDSRLFPSEVRSDPRSPPFGVVWAHAHPALSTRRPGSAACPTGRRWWPESRCRSGMAT